MIKSVKFETRDDIKLYRVNVNLNPLSHFHRHNEVEMTYLESGSFTYLIGGDIVRFPAGRLCVFWGAVPHRIMDLDVPTLFNSLTLPLPFFLQLGLPEQLTAAVLGGSILFEADDNEAASDTLSFQRWDRLLNSPDTVSGEARRIVMLQVEARLRQLVMAHHMGHKKTDISDRSDKIEKMIHFMNENYALPITMDEIAEEAALNPKYATTLFRKQCGMGLMAYLTHLRVTHAQRLLVTTDDKITSIAFASGFGSLTRFYASFASICGCSPRQLRTRQGGLE